VRYAGISDGLLAKTGVAWDERVSVPLSESESAALPLLAEVCPDFRRLLGRQCAALWDRGRKIELEAVTIYPGIDAATLVKASLGGLVTDIYRTPSGLPDGEQG
jgi:hypothetical protein